MPPRTPTFAEIEAEIRAEFGRPRTLSDALAAAPGFAEFVNGRRPHPVTVTAPMAAVTVGTSTDPARIGVAQPSLAAAPLLGAITVVPDVVSGSVHPLVVEATSAADVAAPGTPSDEATITYVAAEVEILDTVAHHVTVSRQDLRHSPTLRRDVDVLLSGGVLVKLEDLVADALAAAESDMVVHPYDTDLETTLRTGVAAAQSAFRELGPGLVTVALSPNDHAELDLADVAVSEWPCRIVSTPALLDGTAYISRLELAVFLYASSASVTMTAGTIDDQLIRNRATILAHIEAHAHVAAPSSIVVADLASS
jgi:hypothetical protein